jgi:hypothetical protein
MEFEEFIRQYGASEWGRFRSSMKTSAPGGRPFIDGHSLRRNALPHHSINVFTFIIPGRSPRADPLVDRRERPLHSSA